VNLIFLACRLEEGWKTTREEVVRWVGDLKYKIEGGDKEDLGLPLV
jgi:hypothetical protein